MFDYLQKFNKLPKDLRDKISSPAVMAEINGLEKEYGITLASVVMKVMTKTIAIADLNKYFLEEENFDANKAEKISEALKTKVFNDVRDHLGIKSEIKTVPSPAEPEPEKQPVKQEEVPIVKGASFFFSSEDEEEIRELTKKISNGVSDNSAGDEIEKKLDTIVSLVQINFGSQELSDRFRSILKTYVRGIRDNIETKQTLKKTFVGGGLGFDVDSTDKVMAIADGVKGGENISMKSPIKIKLPEDEKISDLKNIGVRDLDYDFSSAIAKKTEEKNISSPVERPKNLDISHELAPPPPSLVPINKKTENQSPKKIEPEKAKEKIVPKKQNKMPMEKFEIKRSGGASYRAPVDVAGKKRMEDVKYVPPKTMNPIDELRYMDLVNFRRLAIDPQKQVAKIKEKIDLLEEEKYSKRAEAISAWRQSPVNRLYLDIGHKSISENKPIDVIIEEKKNSGEDYLTPDELAVIMDLNKGLRF